MKQPWLARLWMLLILPASEREFFLGDLDEAFQQQVRVNGLRQATRWYWRQTLRAPAWWHRTSPDFDPIYAEVRKGDLMHGMVQDIRYAFRSLRKSPALMFSVLAALALGIGANTAVFSVVNGILLKPLPYAEPQRLMRLWDSHPPTNLLAFSVTPGNFVEWKRLNTAFAGLGAYREDGFSLSGDGQAERVLGARATAGLLTTLGVSPSMGRWFNEEEDRSGADQVVILGHDLWRRRFGGDPGMIGKSVRIDGTLRSVVGVMPQGFRVPIEGADLWIPYAMDDAKANRDSHFLRVVGRLKPESTVQSAQAEMNRIAESLEEQYPVSNKGWRVRILPLDESISGNVGPTLWTMLGTVGLILMIACANAANLLLVRSVSRRREIGLRLSLGASRGRLIRQFLIESLILSMAGGALGIGLAASGLQFLKTAAPGNIPRVTDISIDPRVLAFTFAISLATGLLFGIVPGVRGSRFNLNESLKSASRGSTTGRLDYRASAVLVIGQIAVAMVVVIASGLMVRTLWNLSAVDPGFQTADRLTFGINLDPGKYSSVRARSAFLGDLVERLRALPGIQNAASTHRLPLTGNSAFGTPLIEGREDPLSMESSSVNYRSITPGYFETMGIPILRGRTFDRRESEEAGGAVVVNQRMAEQFWPGEDPIGKRMGSRVQTGPQRTWLTVVGIVADSKENALDTDSQAGMYLPYAAAPVPAMTVIIQTATNSPNVAGAVRSEIQKLDPDLAIAALTPLGDVVAVSIGERSFAAALLAIFAGIALLLAAAGIYGVLAYTVNQRTPEIGVRIALGATPLTVLKEVITGGLRLILPGIAAGALGAMAATRLLSGLLFQVSAADPVTFLGIAAFLTLIGVAACYIPARKAASVDPIIALRGE